MSNYLFKVKVNLPQGKREIYIRRQLATGKNGCFDQFFEDLLHRYDILPNMVFKITWVDNDGDIIRIVNEDDFLMFFEFKGKEIIVDVREVAENPTAYDIISRTNGTYYNSCTDQSREQLNDLRTSRNEVATAELHENEPVKDKLIELKVKLHKLAKDAADLHHPLKQLSAVTKIRKLVTFGSTPDPPKIEDLSSSGIIQTLVKCLDRTYYSMLQFEAAWAITNIAAGTTDETNRVVDAGAVPLLIRLLASPNSELCEQALWALSNIIGDGPKLRDYVIEMGIIQALSKLIKIDASESVLIEISKVIQNLCCSNKLVPSNQTIVDIMPALKILIDHKAFKILNHIVWALSSIAYIGTEKIQMLIDHGFVPKLILLLGRIEDKLLVAVLNAISNISAGSDQQTQMVLDYAALSYFSTLIKHQNEKVRKNVIWILSNITGGESQIQAVIEAGLLPGIINNMKTGEYTTKINAAWVVSNIATFGNRSQVAQLIKGGALSPFCRLLSSNDNGHLRVLLRGIKYILKLSGRYVGNIADIIEECNGLERIKELQKHEDVEVLHLAEEIIEGFFLGDDDEFNFG